MPHLVNVNSFSYYFSTLHAWLSYFDNKFVNVLEITDLHMYVDYKTLNIIKITITNMIPVCI